MKGISKSRFSVFCLLVSKTKIIHDDRNILNIIKRNYSLEEQRYNISQEFTKGSFTFTLIYSFICVSTYIFAVLINKVSLQVTVEGFVGGSVVLPCSSAEHDLKLQDTNVHWRHNGSKNVFDIVQGKDSLEDQDPRYKNRTKTFPEEYVRGNFSIRLSDLTHADAGRYICLITPSSEQETVELIINEEGNTRIEEETRPDIVEKSWLWILVVPLLTLVILIIVIIFRKKISSCCMSGEHCMGSDALEVVNPGSCYKSVTDDDRDEEAGK